MKIGLISDVHCNADTLGRILDRMDDCDEVLCAGDLLYQFRFSNDVLRLLRDRGVIAIPGNHDKTILYTRGHPLHTAPSVDRGCFSYLTELPSNRQLSLGNKQVALFHGAPWDEIEGALAHYVYPTDESHLRRVADLLPAADVIVLGHTHVPFASRIGRTLIVNPGSCGEANDPTRTVSYAVLDLQSEHAEFLRLPLLVD